MTDAPTSDGSTLPAGEAKLNGLSRSPQFPVAPVRETVTDQIRAAIVHLELKPGQRLVERELVDATGVSRPTIREALQQLAAEGLVSSTRGRGWAVHKPSYAEAEELYEIRAQLEGMVCRRFAERATEEHVTALRAAIESLANTVSQGGDSLALVQHKGEFYNVLFAGSGAVVAQEIIGGLQARITMFRASTLGQPGRPQRMVEEMREIVTAIEARDPDTAKRACIRHVREAARVALELVRQPS